MPDTISTRNKLLLLTAVIASLLEIIDTSIVNVAIPTMMGNLGATLDEISWVITGYIIANAIVLPIAGWMSEQLGRKFYYTGCILLFTASSVACGLAPNLTLLVAFRILQGFAGGALLPTSQALIYEAFPKEKAGIASAIFGMSVMIGPTLGPTLGGYLTDNFGWRSIFNINLPLGIIVAVLSFLFVEDVGFDPSAREVDAQGKIIRKKRTRTPVDAVGLALLVIGLGALQYVLERGHADDWFDSKAITACALLAIIGLISLILWELKTPHPILQLRHFKNKTFRSGMSLMFALGTMLYGLTFVIPVFVNNISGLTATQTGELFIPGALLSAAFMPFIGHQLRKRDTRIFVWVGVIGLGIAALWIGRFDGLTSVDGMFWPLLLRGGAMAYLFVPINTLVLTQFTGPAIGQAAGMLNLCRQLGGSIGIALLSTLLQRYEATSYSVLISHLSHFDPIAVTADLGLRQTLRQKFAGEAGLALPSMESLKVLFNRASQQAFILGYQKMLFIAAVLFLLLAAVPLLFMKATKLTDGSVPDAH